MMYSRLMSGQSRRVSVANFNFYPEPSIHPDRVMTEHDFIYLLEGQWEVCAAAGSGTASLRRASLPGGDAHYVSACFRRA